MTVACFFLSHEPLTQSTSETKKWRATEMAASGFTLGQVLETIERRCAAFIRYLDETSADNLQLLRTALDDSDDE